MRQATGMIVRRTPGPGLFDITPEARAWAEERARGADGLLTLFCRHSSASLTVQENADPDVRRDLEDAFARLAPRGAGYRHAMEGPDDMPAHLRAVLSGVNVAVPLIGGRLALGTWQAIYLWEHRDRPHRREVALHLLWG
ncbi:secondary thiamine-phosphate synthase enzyme YjbQ [Oceanicella actignis]|nr:secondary thiamine-phosphate synthase enzyme YjbQ [Oceanicella actignis]